MREGALPSPVSQARVMHEVLALAKREGYRVNLIEAYDQPWKRQLEGTVGGHWGLYGAYRRLAKFDWGGIVSDHPRWRWQDVGGVGLAATVFATAFGVRRRVGASADIGLWLRIAGIAIVSGALIGWTAFNIPLESLTVGDWLRSLAWAAVALISPIATAAALAKGSKAPTFAQLLRRSPQRPQDLLVLTLGILLIALSVLSVQGALARVRSALPGFPVCPLIGAAAPFLLWAERRARTAG